MFPTITKRGNWSGDRSKKSSVTLPVMSQQPTTRPPLCKGSLVRSLSILLYILGAQAPNNSMSATNDRGRQAVERLDGLSLLVAPSGTGGGAVCTEVTEKEVRIYAASDGEDVKDGHDGADQDALESLTAEDDAHSEWTKMFTRASG
jgi:hypothetical protein